MGGGSHKTKPLPSLCVLCVNLKTTESMRSFARYAALEWTEVTKTMNKSTLGQYGKKLLTIAKIIYLETDRDNPIKVKELRECAEQFGVTLPKSSVYRYISTINDNLFPVKNIPWHGFYRAGDIK